MEGTLSGLGQHVLSQHSHNKARVEAEFRAVNAKLAAQQEELDSIKVVVVCKEARILDLEAEAKKRGEEVDGLKKAVEALKAQADDRSQQLAYIAKCRPDVVAVNLLTDNSKSIEELSTKLRDSNFAFTELVSTVSEIRGILEKRGLTNEKPKEVPEKAIPSAKASPQTPDNNGYTLLLTAALNRFEHCLRLVQQTLRSIGTPAAYLLAHQLDTAMANQQFPVAVDLLYKKCNNLEIQVASSAAMATAALNASNHLHTARLLPLEVSLMTLSEEADVKEVVKLLKGCLKPQAMPIGPQVPVPIPMPMSAPIPAPMPTVTPGLQRPAMPSQQNLIQNPIQNPILNPNPPQIIIGPGGQVRLQPPPNAPSMPKAMRKQQD